MRILLITALMAMVSFGYGSANASDLAKEKRWADQVVDGIMDGEAEYLDDGSSEFLAIYTEAEDDSDRGVVIMHGTGIHPDWQQVIQPLRVDLTTAGWHTLSIQMPVLSNEAEYKEYIPLYPEVEPRVTAAIKFLHDRGVKRIALIGHSQGATMGAYFLREKSDSVAGFVSVSAFHVDGGGPQDLLQSFGLLGVPVLDIYGTEDSPEIVRDAGKRESAVSGARFTQVKIDGANHFYDDREAELIRVVRQWLESGL